MCAGIPILVNNKKAVYGKGTNSHSTTAKNLKVDQDKYRKYEFYWWKNELIQVHYDRVAQDILKDIQSTTSEKFAKELVKKQFSTSLGIYKWLKDVPDEWHELPNVKNKKLKEYLFKKITGYTQKENQLMFQKAKKKADLFVKRVGKVKWFKPQPVINKKDIQLRVELSLGLFHLPKAQLEFKYLSWGAAWDAAWDAARDAAWGAEAIIAEDLKEYKKKYPQNPFMPLFELWEMGLYPIGIVNKKFLIYVPLINNKKPEII